MYFYKNRWFSIIGFLAFFLLQGSFVVGQSTCSLSVQIIDSTNNETLSNVLVSYRFSKQADWKLNYTDNLGRFTFTLPLEDSIYITFSYLGYTEVTKTFSCTDSQDNKITIRLASSSLWIKEVQITDKLPPIIQKEDTIIYKVDSFRTGRETKLKAVLNKLPGVHVNRQNEITVKGEKVQEVLVEGERFFTGDAALAVKYIPADVIDKIEILEKYNEVRMLQGQDSGDRLALNVRLKKDKKHFLFGDFSLGTDFQQRHHIHANTFYYSPKTRINSIGNFNTTDNSALSMVELFRLIGLRLNQYDPSNHQLSGLADMNELSSLFLPTEYFDKRSFFGVAQVQHRFKNNWSADALLLGLDQQESVLRESLSVFVDAEAGEEQSKQGIISNMGRELLKVNFSSNPNGKSFLSYNWQYHFVPTNQSDLLRNTFRSLSSNVNYQSNQRQLSNAHEVNWLHEWNSKVQSIFQARYHQTAVDINDEWIIDGQQIPSIYEVDTTALALQQIQTNKVNTYYLLGRLNFELSDQSRLFTFLRTNGQSSNLFSNALLYDSPLSSLGFGLDNTFDIHHWVVGFRYLRQLESLKIKVGVDYLNGAWTALHRNEPKQQITRLAPSIHISALLDGFGELSLDYHYQIGLPDAQSSLDGILIRNFNQFQNGNPFLSPTAMHSLGIYFLRGKYLKGRQINASLVYQRTNQAILGGFNLRDNNLIWIYQNSPQAFNKWLALFRLQQVNRGLKIVSSTRFIYSSYVQSINEVNTQLKQFAAYVDLDFSNGNKQFEWNTQLEIGLRGAPQSNTTQWFLDNTLTGDCRIFLGEYFQLSTATNLRHISAKGFNQSLFQVDLGIQYTTKNERYTFQVRANNLFNQLWNAENSFTQFSNTSTRYLLMPRFIQGAATVNL